MGCKPVAPTVCDSVTGPQTSRDCKMPACAPPRPGCVSVTTFSLQNNDECCPNPCNQKCSKCPATTPIQCDDGSCQKTQLDCKNKPPPGKVCCKAKTATCLACLAKTTVPLYCAQNDNWFTPGCSKKPPTTGKVCCKAKTASCLACQKGVTPHAYCLRAPSTSGCKTDPKNTKKKVYKVKHKIQLRGMSPKAFNTNKKVIKSFVESVALLLEIDSTKITNVRACKIGATDAECPGEVTADTSADPTTTDPNNRRLDGNDCEIRYDIVAEDVASMDAVADKIRGAAYQKEDAFSTTFQTEMKKNDVEKEVSDLVQSSQTDSAADEVVQEVDDKKDDDAPSNGTPNTVAADAGNDDKKDDDSGSLGLIVALLAGVIVVGAVGGLGYYVYAGKRRRSSGNSDVYIGADAITLEMGDCVAVENVSYGSTNAPATAFTVPDSPVKLVQNDDGSSQWDIHLDPKTGNKYRVHKTKGVTEWM